MLLGSHDNATLHDLSAGCCPIQPHLSASFPYIYRCLLQCTHLESKPTCVNSVHSFANYLISSLYVVYLLPVWCFLCTTARDSHLHAQ